MARRSSNDPKKSDQKDLLRKVYFPYVGLVYIPALANLTVSLGLISLALSKVDKRASFHCGTLWSWLLCRLNFTKVDVVGRGNADPKQSYIIMSNHQSYFDILAFYGHWGRQFRWVMKKELRKVPVLGTACDEMGHIYIDRSNRERAIASLREAQEKLEPGVSVMIFPEGSRSPDGRLGEFKKGGFVMAQQMGLPILPVSISGASDVLPEGTLQAFPGKIRITIHEPIDTTKYEEENRPELMDEVREVIASGLTEWERGNFPSKSGGPC